jgi:hypothetical protein
MQRSSAIIKPTSFFFVDFRKYFDLIPRKNLWNSLEEINVPFKLRETAIRLYENVIAKFKNNEA